MIKNQFDPRQVVIDQAIKRKREDITLSNAKNNATAIMLNRMPLNATAEQMTECFQYWLKYLYTINVQSVAPKKVVKKQVKKDVKALLRKANKKIKNAKTIQQQSKPVV